MSSTFQKLKNSLGIDSAINRLISNNDLGMNDSTFGITNTGNISEMPTNPIGTSTSVRFALTLYS